jgi:hypothetical protein
MHKGAHYIDKLVLVTVCLSYGMAAFPLAFRHHMRVTRARLDTGTGLAKALRGLVDLAPSSSYPSLRLRLRHTHLPPLVSSAAGFCLSNAPTRILPVLMFMHQIMGQLSRRGKELWLSLR